MASRFTLAVLAVLACAGAAHADRLTSRTLLQNSTSGPTVSPMLLP